MALVKNERRGRKMAKYVCYICRINGKQVEVYDPKEAEKHISSHFPACSNFEEKEEKYKKAIEEITCSLKFFKDLKN